MRIRKVGPALSVRKPGGKRCRLLDHRSPDKCLFCHLPVLLCFPGTSPVWPPTSVRVFVWGTESVLCILGSLRHDRLLPRGKKDNISEESGETSLVPVPTLPGCLQCTLSPLIKLLHNQPRDPCVMECSSSDGYAEHRGRGRSVTKTTPKGSQPHNIVPSEQH